MKIDIFHFSKWCYPVKRKRKHLEKLAWSRTHRDFIKICDLKVSAKLFVIQALMD